MDLGDRIKLKRPLEERLRLKPGCWKRHGDVWTEWVAQARDPHDLLTKKGRLRRARVVGEGLNFRRLAEQLNENVPPEFQITWQELTKFNWGTDTPAEINWYLWLYLGPHLQPTHDRKNYRFRGKPAEFGRDFERPIHHTPFIWVPEYSPPPSARRIPAERQKTIVIDERSCPYRERGIEEPQCRRVWRWREAPFLCGRVNGGKSRSPAAEDSDAFVEIESARAEESLLGKILEFLNLAEENVLGEVQELKDLEMWVTRSNVYRVTTPAGSTNVTFAETPSERLTRIMIGTQLSKRFDDAPPGAKPFRGPPPDPSPLPTCESHQLAADHGHDELAGVAKSIRDLHTLGMLARLVIRAYEDRSVQRTVEERANYTTTRAKWMFHALRDAYRLPLFLDDKADSGVGADVKRYNRERGLIPVLIVGCGAGDAWEGREDPRHRVAIVDYETKRPEPRKEVSFQRLVAWEVYETLSGGPEVGGNAGGPGCLVHSGPSDFLARDEATLDRLRREIWPYLTIFSEAAGESATESVRELRNEILAWTPDAGVAGGAEKLTLQYYSQQKPPYCLETAWDIGANIEVDRETSEVARSKLWLDPDLGATPNHRRHCVEQSSWQVSEDEVRQVSLLVGARYRTTQRVHFAAPPPPAKAAGAE